MWKQACASTKQEAQELNPGVTVEGYLDTKYYHYDPVDLTDLVDIDANFVNMVNEDNIQTVPEAIIDENNVCTSVADNIRELDNACPSWEENTEAVHPKG